MSLGLKTVGLLEKWIDGSAKQCQQWHRALIRQVINVLKLLGCVRVHGATQMNIQ